MILEEIKMDEDNPDYLVHEIFTQNFFKDHPLGKPILGTKDTVRRFDQDAILAYYGGKFAPGNMIISAAGNVEHQDFVELLREQFCDAAGKGTNGWHDSPPKINSRIILAQQEIPGAGADLRGRAVVSDQPRSPLRDVHAEHAAGRRHEFAAVPERAREAGAGVLHLLRAESLPRYGMLSVYAGTSRESAPKVVQSIVHEFRR